MLLLKRILFVVSISICFMNTTCEAEDEMITDFENVLKGYWVSPSYSDDEITFKRASALDDEGYGVSFKENGDFIERSSGWCVTPPLFFSDYNGVWDIDDMLITITQESFSKTYTWRIVSLSKNELVVKIELMEQEKDYRELMNLYNEINELQSNITCANSNDWAFVAYGAKACGGPQGYIPYSNLMDADVFLEKVKAYTKLEKEFNIKWGIVSTCDLISRPTGVECQNGYAVLIY